MARATMARLLVLATVLGAMAVIVHVRGATGTGQPTGADRRPAPAQASPVACEAESRRFRLNFPEIEDVPFDVVDAMFAVDSRMFSLKVLDEQLEPRAEVRRVDDRTLEVDLYCVEDPATVGQVLTARGYVEIVDARERSFDAGARVTTAPVATPFVVLVAASPEATPLGAPFPAILDSGSILEATLPAGGTSVELWLNAQGAAALASYLRGDHAYDVAVVVDGIWRGQGPVTDPDFGRVVVAGLDEVSAKVLVILVNSGPLPAPATLVSDEVID